MSDESNQASAALTETESSNDDAHFDLGIESAFALSAVFFGAISGIVGVFIGVVAFALEQFYALDWRRAHNIYATDRAWEGAAPFILLIASVNIAPIAGSVIGIIGGAIGGIISRLIGARLTNQKVQRPFWIVGGVAGGFMLAMLIPCVCIFGSLLSINQR